MEKSRYQVKKEYYNEASPILSASIQEIEIEVSAFSIYTGAIKIHNIGEGQLEGRIFSKKDSAQFTPEEWRSNEQVILYRIDTQEMMWGKQYEDVWLIESNGGEQEIPVHIRITKPLLTIDEQHSISDMKDFSEYAKENWNNAKDVFFSPLFSNWLLQNNDLESQKIYQQLSMTPHKDWALEYFLRLTGCKRKPSLSVQDKARKVEIFPTGEKYIEKGIVLHKNGWGLMDIQLETNVKWIQFSKTHYTQEDFRKDKLILQYEILVDKIIPKKDFGYIFITYEDVKIPYEVRVVKKDVFHITLSKNAYKEEDKGILVIENKTGYDARIQIIPREPWIQFEAKKFLIAKRAEIPFKVRLTGWDKLGMGKKPHFETMIHIEAHAKTYKYEEDFAVKIDSFNLEALISQGEETTEKLPSGNKLVNAMTYWIKGQLYEKERQDYYIKALNLLNTLYIENPTELKTGLMIIALNLRLERYDEAYNLLKNYLKFKKYFKTTDQTLLGVIYYFKALLDYYCGKHMFIQKSIKIFDECLEKQKSGILYFLKAKLEKELFNEDYDEIKYYYEAYTHGFRSPLLYVEVFRLFCSHYSNFYNMKDMIRNTFIWAIKYKLLDQENIKLFAGWMLQSQEDFRIPLSYLEQIHSPLDTNETLSLLCNAYIKEGTKDQTALEIYEKAIERRIFVKGIYLAYIKTSYALDKRDIPLSILQTALVKENFDEPLTAYIYSLLCTNNQYKMLFQVYYNKILLFGESSLRNNRKGRHYIDIYLKMFEKNSKNQLLKKAVFEQLFLYEIHVKSPLIKYLWIMEKEKANMATYTVNGDSIYLEAASPDLKNLTILCVGQRQKSFYSGDCIKVHKLVKDIPVELLLEFYEEGYKSTDLLIALTCHFIDQIQKNEEADSIFHKAEQIIMECLENSALSDDFRRKTSAALGSLLVRHNSLEKAAPYFKLLNPIELSPSQIEEGINALLEKDEVLLALQWAQKLDAMHASTKLKLVKKSIAMGIVNALITNTSYELFMEGHYDKDIEIYLISHYEGSLKTWLSLREAIISLDGKVVDLDQKILEKGIWIRGLNEALEKVFLSLYENNNISPIIHEFIYYCSYEILVNHKTISQDTLKKFEEIFLDTKDMILGSAMLHIYPKLQDHGKEKILLPIFEWMKENQFIFPIVKKNQDKFPYYSYIEQNVPFIHRTKWGREVTFCYKIQGFPLNRKRMYPVAFNLYAVCVSLFYNEDMEYYIEELDEEGNCIISEVYSYHNDVKALSKDSNEVYNRLNNAIIYSENLEMEKAEMILESLIYDNQKNNTGYLL
ncbi:DUF5717 family protein [Defluviitalea saccharophila]|uniref:DUF5717 family protein n=1 Tax=Defluviitalea saccharophila TaxID=879970 RepID=A0ABZ2Y818_9FIRM